MKFHYWDIESLDNIFTLAYYKSDENHIDLFLLLDNKQNFLFTPDFNERLIEHVHNTNKNFKGTVKIRDLKKKENNELLAQYMGISDADSMNSLVKIKQSKFPQSFRAICDTDPTYDKENTPYILGYNSQNYDLTMLATYFDNSFTQTSLTFEQKKTMTQDKIKKAELRHFEPTTAQNMRDHNNKLFTPEFKNNMTSYLWTAPKDANMTKPNQANIIYRNMLNSGRHIDVARLNEKQQRVGLKRLLGLLGLQIKESDKLIHQSNVNNQTELIDLIAYNISDVVNLEQLFKHPYYQGQFELKLKLLETYPETIYLRNGKKYEPKVDPEFVDRKRLTPCSSSAQFAQRLLAPYNQLEDIDAVDFTYPSEEMSKKYNIKQINVLKESKKFFYKHFTKPELRKEFNKVYQFYKNIEGKNFNDTLTEKNPNIPLHTLKEVNDEDSINLHYFTNLQEPSSCYVTFSTGGIHGAELNTNYYEKHYNSWKQWADLLLACKKAYNNDAYQLRLDKQWNGHSYKTFLKSNATIKAMKEKKQFGESMSEFWQSADKNKPVLFKVNASGKIKPNPKYAFTSTSLTNHEDFTSYYPNMLRMLSAFKNDELGGKDRYSAILDDKARYGKLMKDKTKTPEERKNYAILREGTKLILNTASGAGDANFKSNIKMNNRIISMRCIGQLFSWRIGQAQTLQGARVISTNTDGLYTVMEAETNNQILEKESKQIGVEIVPEVIYLISKDSNNRLELDTNYKTISASGGTLSCCKSISPTKSLNHPAIIDYALKQYLTACLMPHEYLIRLGYTNVNLTNKFDINVGKQILQRANINFDKVELVKMFSNIIAASTTSNTYNFASSTTEPKNPNTDIVSVLQHYNRVFYMKPGTPNTYHLFAAHSKKITPATKAKRERIGEIPEQDNPVGLKVLKINGLTSTPPNEEASIKKITNLNPNWYVYIENRDLYTLTEQELDFILNNLNIDNYAELVESTYTKNWQNQC